MTDAETLKALIEYLQTCTLTPLVREHIEKITGVKLKAEYTSHDALMYLNDNHPKLISEAGKAAAKLQLDDLIKSHAISIPVAITRDEQNKLFKEHYKTIKFFASESESNNN